MTDMTERALVNAATGLEFRDDGGLTFEGYAAVWNSPSQPLPFIETIAPGAFARSLRNVSASTNPEAERGDIRLFVNHKSEYPLASTRAGTLNLSEDAHGLRVQAELAPTSYAQDLKVLSARGELRGMSFAFKPVKGGETWSPDRQHRTLTDVKLFEVSIITHGPAYQATSASLRSLAEEIARDADELAAAFDALSEGRTLDDATVALLEAAIAARREAPAHAPIPLSIVARRLELASKV